MTKPLNYCKNLCSLIEIWCDLGVIEYCPMYNAEGELIEENFKLKLRYGRWSYIRRCPACGKILTGI